VLILFIAQCTAACRSRHLYAATYREAELQLTVRSGVLLTVLAVGGAAQLASESERPPIARANDFGFMISEHLSIIHCAILRILPVHFDDEQ